MADLKNNSSFEVVMSRFGDRQLTGNDLQQIRTSLLGLSQEALGEQWGISRNEISRIERKPNPDLKTCDAYRGLALLRFFMKE